MCPDSWAVQVLGKSRRMGTLPLGKSCWPWGGEHAGPVPGLRPWFPRISLVGLRTGQWPVWRVWALMWAGHPAPTCRVPGGHAEVQGVDEAPLPELLQPPGRAPGPPLVPGHGESGALGLAPPARIACTPAQGLSCQQRPGLHTYLPGENPSFLPSVIFLVRGSVLSPDLLVGIQA